MDRIYRNLNIIIPVLLILLLSSCTREKEIRAAYTFGFLVIFIIFCVPGTILSAVSRSAQGNTAKIIGIILTSIGGFFGLIYTMNYLENRYASHDNQITAFVFLLWATVLTSAILLMLPKPPQEEDPNYTGNTTPRNSTGGKVFQSEEEILQAAERIKQKKAQQESVQNSEYLNKDEKADSSSDVDMSGLDDL